MGCTSSSTAAAAVENTAAAKATTTSATTTRTPTPSYCILLRLRLRISHVFIHSKRSCSSFLIHPPFLELSAVVIIVKMMLMLANGRYDMLVWSVKGRDPEEDASKPNQDSFLVLPRFCSSKMQHICSTLFLESMMDTESLGKECSQFVQQRFVTFHSTRLL
jgi:hypothetical protein